MTWGSLAASALTAALTLAGGLILLRFQTVTKAGEERRAARRQWHAEAVDVVVDVASLIMDAGLVALGVPIRGIDEGSPDTRTEPVDLQKLWMMDLRRRVQRIARGHPDAIMRTEANRLGAAAERAVRIVLSTTGSRRGYGEDEVLRIFDSELLPVARSYVRHLHGERADSLEESVSRLRRTYNIYVETGVLVKPAEMSP